MDRVYKTLMSAMVYTGSDLGLPETEISNCSKSINTTQVCTVVKLCSDLTAVFYGCG